MNFGFGYAFSAAELFDIFDPNRLHIKHTVCCKKFNVGNRRLMAVRVFLYAVKSIFDDIIDNNVIFELPRNCGEIHFKKIEKDEFIKLWKRGRWREIDYLATNFTTFLLIWSYKKPVSGIIKEKTIHISPNQKKRLIENINNGKLYY